MKVATLILLSAAVVYADDGSEDADDALRDLEQTYREQAAGYELFRDKEHTQELVLADVPVYKWTDAQEKGRTGGMVFIWTWMGKPESIAAIFSNPVGPQHRRITHEFHSLSTEVLCPATRRWQPLSGISSTPVADAPDVAGTAAARMAQMRSIARRFSCNTVDREGQRWEMRFLPQPLFRHTPADSDEMSDGAVFAFVTSELTDPEVILLLETTRADGGDIWSYSLVRFSGYRTYVRYDDEEIWNSIPTVIEHNEDHTYRLLQQPLVEETWR